MVCSAWRWLLRSEIFGCKFLKNLFCCYKSLQESISSRATKIILYKTPIRPAVLCGAEGWTVTEKEEHVLLIFGRKIFRRVYGAKYENGEWKSGTNRQLEEMSKGENIVK